MTTIDIRYVIPENKDYDRVKNIKSEAQAQKMANSIKDYDKLARRGKAYYNTYKKANNPFYRKMIEFNFSRDQMIYMVHPQFAIRYKNEI